MSATSVQHTTGTNNLSGIARLGDGVMYFTLFGQMTVSLAIGQYHGSMGLALACSAIFLTIGNAAYFMARGSMLSQIAKPTC